ncbi:hypothetical protein [Ileibacterium valens]|nr:hypothetical protein [Ileibacterium valens]
MITPERAGLKSVPGLLDPFTAMKVLAASLIFITPESNMEENYAN